ncbi:MAG: hypothetical protein Q9220_002297 [cf. Caloplaca sp. 1 TL-2023]
MELNPESTWTRIRRSFHNGARSRLTHFRSTQIHNLQTFRSQPLQEISGSFGDLGTLLPILIAYTDLSSRYNAVPAIDLGATLVFTGLSNIITGLCFGIPLPVQPMKAIAAVALSRSFNGQEVASAGLFVAAVVGALTITGLLEWFNRRIPVPVIKGIQVGVGLSLISYGGGGILFKADELTYKHPDLRDCLLVVTFVGFFISNAFRGFPYAIVLLFLGVLVTIPRLVQHPVALGWWRPHAFVPSPERFVRGMDAGLGQIPLTVLNSIIAVTALSAELLPAVPAPSVTAIGVSVTAMNLVGCWFGCMPVCHGSGGLAAQYRFGARSGASVIFLGSIKLLLGLFAARFAKQVFQGIPNAVLGIMIIAAGLEIANVGESLNTAQARDLSQKEDGGVVVVPSSAGEALGEELSHEQRKRRWMTMFITVGGIVAFKNDAVGFLAGMICHWSYLLHDRYVVRRSQREGTIRLDV